MIKKKSTTIKPKTIDRATVSFLLSEERTLLSKQRTAMSFMRTGLGFLTAGIAVLGFVQQTYLRVMGVGLLIIGITLLIRTWTKVMNYRERTERLKKLLRKNGYDYFEHLDKIKD